MPLEYYSLDEFPDASALFQQNETEELEILNEYAYLQNPAAGDVAGVHNVAVNLVGIHQEAGNLDHVPQIAGGLADAPQIAADNLAGVHHVAVNLDDVLEDDVVVAEEVETTIQTEEDYGKMVSEMLDTL
ncbi:hypothetical protein TKK_0012247 [Trichogramma kaykai]